MQTEYPIQNSDGTISVNEPVVGAWYCGFKQDARFPEGFRDGEIAQYVGGGEFYDEGAEDQTDMAYYDHLIKQH